MGVGQLSIRLLLQSASSLHNAQSLPLKRVLREDTCQVQAIDVLQTSAVTEDRRGSCLIRK